MTRSRIITLVVLTIAVAGAAALYFARSSLSVHTHSETQELDLTNEAPISESFSKDIERLESIISAPTPNEAEKVSAQKLVMAWRELKDFTRPVDELIKEDNVDAIKEQVK